MPRGIPNVKVLTPGEAMAIIKGLDETDAKSILYVLVGAWANNKELWPSISAALGKPAKAEMASAK